MSAAVLFLFFFVNKSIKTFYLPIVEMMQRSSTLSDVSDWIEFAHWFPSTFENIIY